MIGVFMIDDDLMQLYLRFAKLSRSLVRIQAELDNVRESIRQKGL